VVTGQVGTLARGADVIPVLAAARKRVYELSYVCPEPVMVKRSSVKRGNATPVFCFSYLDGRGLSQVS
jgi:hypothetical protein